MDGVPVFDVSTHSRLKAAEIWTLSVSNANNVSTHSRLKAAAEANRHHGITANVSTHSRLKAAAMGPIGAVINSFSFNTQPPEGGCSAHWAAC